MIGAPHPPKQETREEDREASRVGDRDEVCDREEQTTQRRARPIKGYPKDRAVSTD